MTPYRTGKNAILLRSYIDSIRRKEKIDLHSLEGTHTFEELWLMCNADAHGTLGREAARRNIDNFIFNFSCPALKDKCYFFFSLT